MSATDDRAQLDWEARFARPAAVAAFGSALSLLLSFFAPTLAAAPADDIATTISANAPAYLIATALQALGVALLAFVFYYLYRVTGARRSLHPAALVLGIAGPLVFAVVTVITQVERVSAARAYLASADPVTEEGAAEALAPQQFASDVLIGISLAALLALAFAFVMMSLTAMRAGLFSRFLGILGIGLGALTVLGGSLPVPPPVLLQLFWTAALGFLFLDRWPGGRGPAWERVEAVPWPTAAERMEAQQRQRLEAQGLDSETAAGEAPQPQAQDRPRPASRKRRRGGRS